MTSNWTEPQAEDVNAFMSSVVVNRANENDKVARLLSITVRRVRGVVGRTNTLSDNEAEVPPEGLQHCLVLAAFALLTGTPNFGFVMKGADGSESGFTFLVKQAEKWLEDVRNGMSVTYPTNPATSGPELVRYGGEDTVDTTAA